MSNNPYLDIIDKLVAADVDDHYEGSGVNDRTLGQMYYLKKYENAAKAGYDTLRKQVQVPEDISEKQVVHNDKRFSAVAVPRQGSSKLDRTLLRSELIALLVDKYTKQKLQTGEPVSPSQRAAIAADELLGRCTVYGADSVAVTVMEDRRDD